MSSNELSRRRLLRGVTVGAAGTGLVGTASGRSTNSGRSTKWIVGLRSDVDFTAAERAATAIDRELEFGRFGKVFVGQIPDQAIETLRRHPHVRYVEKDQPAQALGQTTPWGIERVDADVVHDEGETGLNSEISIIDTGIELDHESLAENIEGGAAFGTTCSDCIEPYGDDNGHGTHCAGTAGAADNDVGVVGVATEPDLYSVKVLDSTGGGSFSDIAAGIEWAADQGHDVASLSLGGSSGTTSLREAVQYADSQGTLVVAAAGNDGCCDTVGYPAAYDEAVAVSATTDTDEIASFSSRGPEVDIAAPGADVLSTYLDDSYDTLSGTSMACPHVAGTAAHLMADGFTNHETRWVLQETAEDIDLDPNDQGHGLLDAATAILEDHNPGEWLYVTTDSATDVSDTTATLNGTIENLGTEDGVEVFFEWGESGAGFPNQTPPETISSPSEVEETISGLDMGTEYEYRVVAAGSEQEDSGMVQSFTTDDDSSCFMTTATAGHGPTLDSLRRFRDESMAATPIGRALIGLYHRVSPPVASTMELYPASRSAHITRSLVKYCGLLADRHADTDASSRQLALAVLLTLLYIVGLLIATAGHLQIRLREICRGK